jgi:hypothetical protein
MLGAPVGLTGPMGARTVVLEHPFSYEINAGS